MYIQLSIYFCSVILVMSGLESLNINKFVKVNKPKQARILYVMIALGLSQLVASFIIQFLEFSKII